MESANRGRNGRLEAQLATLGAEVVRGAERFASDRSVHRERECVRAAETVAAAG